VSLNFEHIARPWTVEKVRKVNIREGFDGIGIYRPVEGARLMKTVQDYMNDPRITNDPALKDSLELSKEIHAIRLKVQDENVGLSVDEINRRAEATLASWGISMGKMKAAVEV
jgi:hypothetical protein